MMAIKGRPPITRARVINYLSDHPGCSIMQIVRATGAHRRHVQRLIRAQEKCCGAIFAA